MGTLTFGLVSVPVKLYSAVTPKTVHFHQLHATDHARIQMKRVCSADEEEVPFSQVVKGFELAPDRYVVIEPEELAAIEPAFTRSIDIEDFVELSEIDSIYLDHPYYLVPGTGGAKSYRLLLESMRDTGKVAIARIVLRSRERLVSIRPREDALLMTTMNFGDEVSSHTRLREMQNMKVDVSERELSVARRLVESISESFDISKYHDTYREALLDLIDRKAAGEEIVVHAPREREELQAPDLMSALQASLDAVREREAGGGNGKSRKRASAAPAEDAEPPSNGSKPAAGANGAGKAKSPKKKPAASKAAAGKAAAVPKKPQRA
ncbi:MAG TPA: Ku protein [Solirubrobacteraceae bacterium]|nr:Ku protein [Solirubrobacteraceae bacterium]